MLAMFSCYFIFYEDWNFFWTFERFDNNLIRHNIQGYWRVIRLICNMKRNRENFESAKDQCSTVASINTFFLFALPLRKTKLRNRPTGMKKYLNHGGFTKSVGCDSCEVFLYLRFGKCFQDSSQSRPSNIFLNVLETERSLPSYTTYTIFQTHIKKGSV